MRKNRIVSKRMSRISVHTMHIGAIMLTFFAMVILNLMASSRCSQLTKSIADKESILNQKKDELKRSIVKWESTKSSDKLNKALRDWGMAMQIPSHNQLVRMNERGDVLPGQMSVAILRRKIKERATASVEMVQPHGRARRVIR